MRAARAGWLALAATARAGKNRPFEFSRLADNVQPIAEPAWKFPHQRDDLD